MRRRISVVRVCPSVGPFVRGSICPLALRKNAVYRVLGTSYVGYLACFFFKLDSGIALTDDPFFLFFSRIQIN